MFPALCWYNSAAKNNNEKRPLSQPAPAISHADLNARLQAENESLRSELAELKHKYDWLTRQLFGRKSEKRLFIDNPDQGQLLNGSPEVDAAPTPEQTITYNRRRKTRENTVTDSGLRFDETVPVTTIEVIPDELKGAQADQYEIIDHKETHRLAQRPGSYEILRYRHPVLKHRHSQQLITTPAPANVLDKSLADVSFLAGMLVDKFCYHLPLYRQHQRLAQNGIQLARGTLTNLGERAIALLKPIHQALLAHVLQSRVLAMDETGIKAGRQGKGKMRQGWFWPLYGEDDEVVFHYSRDRGGSTIQQLLGDSFTGTLLTDGLEAYARFAAAKPDITHAQCWAHTRRYFERALEAEPEAAGQALAHIGGLYKVEETIRTRELTGEGKLKLRRDHSEPKVTAFWAWCDQQCQRHDLAPSNPLTKALKYAMARVGSLKIFLGDPDVPIDTNHLERALRPVPMGRKNWLFCWTELGAEQVAIIQSLLATCRLHGVDPYTYLVDVLQRVGEHPAAKVIELTPRVWKERFAADPLRSDIARQ